LEKVVAIIRIPAQAPGRDGRLVMKRPQELEKLLPADLIVRERHAIPWGEAPSSSVYKPETRRRALRLQKFAAGPPRGTGVGNGPKSP